MVQEIENYSFNHAAKTITFSDYTFPKIEHLSAVLNITRGAYLYKAEIPDTLGGTFSGNVLTLIYNTAGTSFADTDKLAIYYNDGPTVAGTTPDVIKPTVAAAVVRDLSTYSPPFVNGNIGNLFMAPDGGLYINQGVLDRAVDKVSIYGRATADQVDKVTVFTNSAGASTSVLIKASAGNVYKISAVNMTATILHIYLYDKVNPTSSDTPLDEIVIPAGVEVSVERNYGLIPLPFATALYYRCVSGSAINSTTNPTTSPRIYIHFS